MMVIGVILTVIIPIVEGFVMPVNGSIKPSWIISDIFLYPVAGWFVDRRLSCEKFTTKRMLLIWVINIGNFITSVCCERSYLLDSPGDKSEVFLRITCLINAVTLFITARWIICRWRENVHRKEWISRIGQLTFGIYLTHIIVLWKIPFLMSLWNRVESTGAMGIYFSVGMTFLIAGLGTYIFEKIPLVKEII